jgi:hypothetical protein
MSTALSTFFSFAFPSTDASARRSFNPRTHVECLEFPKSNVSIELPGARQRRILGGRRTSPKCRLAPRWGTTTRSAAF